VVPINSASNGTENQSAPAIAVQQIPQQAVTTTINDNNIDIPNTSDNNLDSPINYLAYILVALGVGSVIVIVFLFKNSISEEETA
jgi:hypothetical protein